MRSCPACNEALSAGASGCERCGADLSPIRQVQSLHAQAVAEGYGALRLGLYQAALFHLARAAQLAPLSGEAAVQLGLSLLGAGRPRSALPLLVGTELLGRIGQHLDGLLRAEARYGAAREKALSGDVPAAIELLGQGEATPDGLLLFGLCLLHQGDAEGAKASFSRVLSADPSNLRAAALLRL